MQTTLIPNTHPDLWLFDIAANSDYIGGDLLDYLDPVIAWRQCADYLVPLCLEDSNDFTDGGYVLIHRTTLRWWHPCYATGVGLPTLQKHLQSIATPPKMPTTAR